jgi:hypothetical protein
MDWQGWITFGFVATGVLTGVMVAAQLAGFSRVDLPLILGSIFVDDADKARVVGMLAHLIIGQFFALIYLSAFNLIDRAEWWMGAGFGIVHGLAALTLVVPLLPGIHPRMASERSGPELISVLEPPGWMGLNYGRATPVVTLVAHIAYGAILGGFTRA